MPPLKKLSPESIRAIARNPNLGLKSFGMFSRSHLEHHIRTKRFQELLTKMDTLSRQSINQNLRKLAETAGFSDFALKLSNFPLTRLERNYIRIQTNQRKLTKHHKPQPNSMTKKPHDTQTGLTPA